MEEAMMERVAALHSLFILGMIEPEDLVMVCSVKEMISSDAPPAAESGMELARRLPVSVCHRERDGMFLCFAKMALKDIDPRRLNVWNTWIEERLEVGEHWDGEAHRRAQEALGLENLPRPAPWPES